MDPAFAISIDSDIANIPEVSTRLEEAMQAAGFTSEAILDTQLAVEEAITNVIVHGYQGPGGKIDISCQSRDNRVEVRIIDASPRFDPRSIPEPDINAGVEERQIGGLGIYLIRQVMDAISYQYENGRNVLTLQKNKTE
jgi:serine/threonine-protein kinase RsbW